MNIIIICHEAKEWGMVNGQRSEIGSIADCWDKLIYELDLAIQIVKRGPQRFAIVKKSRLVGFPDGETFPLTYDEFAARYGKEFIEAGSDIVLMALPEQIAEVKKLLEIVKIDEVTIQKGFTKANVESWEEMTQEQIAAWQKFLKGKLAS
jgi:hypothetical protein